MTVAHGTQSETVTVPAVVNQRYETIISPMEDGHDQATIVEPMTSDKASTIHDSTSTEEASSVPTSMANEKASAISNTAAEQSLDGKLVLPAIPNIDYKTEDAVTPTVSLTPDPELLAATVTKQEAKTAVVYPAVTTTNSMDQVLLPAATRLKRFLTDTDEILVCPGVYDGFSARIALSVGFKAMYMVS